jgi:hypothetical protein
MSNRQSLKIETRDAGRVSSVSPFLQLNSDLSLAAIALLRKAQGVLECRLRGGSMGQAIPAGSRIHISFVDPRSYRTGQVIAFLVGNGMCVHRIAYISHRRRGKNYLITQGDCCLFPDLPVKVESVLGPVTEFDYAGNWKPPGALWRNILVRRLFSFMVLTILAAVIEIDVNIARWLVMRLQRIERISVRVRACFRPRQAT